jgi:hypothetical protein
MLADRVAAGGAILYVARNAGRKTGIHPYQTSASLRARP